MGQSDSKSNQKPLVICIDGVISAGKSTFVRLLEERLGNMIGKKITCMYEPADRWTSEGVLDQFYKSINDGTYDMTFPFQLYTFVTRMASIKQEYEANPDVDIVILERSIFSDRHIFVEMLKDAKMMDERHYNVYKLIWEFLDSTWEQVLPTRPNAYVLLDAGIDTCMERIEKRNRPGEDKITSDYQQKLREKHHQFFDMIEEPTFTIDTNINFLDDETGKQQILGQFIDILKQINMTVD